MEFIGRFEVKSGKLVVSDPCYDRGTHGAEVVENAANGSWSAWIQTTKKTAGWGTRVAQLEVWLRGVSSEDPGMVKEGAEFEVGVDSGQVGIFDDIVYPETKPHTDASFDEKGDPNEKDFYGLCCAKTLSNEQAGIVPGGCVSSSGYGDGSYSCNIWRTNTGQVVGITVTFISDEELSEDDPWL